MAITKPITFILLVCILSFFLQTFEAIDGPLNPSHCTVEHWCGDDWVGHKTQAVIGE